MLVVFHTNYVCKIKLPVLLCVYFTIVVCLMWPFFLMTALNLKTLCKVTRKIYAPFFMKWRKFGSCRVFCQQKYECCGDVFYYGHWFSHGGKRTLLMECVDVGSGGRRNENFWYFEWEQVIPSPSPAHCAIGVGSCSGLEDNVVWNCCPGEGVSSPFGKSLNILVSFDAIWFNHIGKILGIVTANLCLF